MLYERMNLQRFAGEVAHPFDMNVQTTLLHERAGVSGGTKDNDLSAENKTFYDRVLLEEASANLVHDQFAQKRPIPANGGKTIEFRKFSALPKALTALTEGVTPNGRYINVDAATAEVAQYGDYVTLSDMLELTAIDNVIVETTKLIGKQAGLTLDTITRDIITAGTNVMYAPNIGAGGAETAVAARSGLDDTSVLTVKLIQKAVAKLRAQNAPAINGKYVAIVHPYTAYQLMRDPEWIDAHKYAQPQELYNGEIGEIAGVRFVSSSEAKILSGTSVTDDGSSIFCTLILGENAYGVTEISGGGLQTIIKQKGSGEDPLNQRSTIGWKAIKTAKILYQPYMIRIEHCVTDYATTPAN